MSDEITEELFYIYILSNEKNTILYVGFTKNLKRRVLQHKSKSSKGFTSQYKCTKLVYFESTIYVLNAIKREKQIKKWNREWKENLINDMNPDWNDLYWMIS
ncbi:GIY-YIG nuclease family protein [Rasiella sp. SM2506]|uniref:GIY-YIG nuclease family protein n=1 Tax=Rasiella sp. SM2506 TaxID=3423914 RepID=UPI003D7A6021